MVLIIHKIDLRNVIKTKKAPKDESNERINIVKKMLCFDNQKKGKRRKKK